MRGRGIGTEAAKDRESVFSTLLAGGVLLGPLGSVPLDEITAQTLRVWWAEQIEGPGRSVGTGRHYLDVLSAVLGYAVDLGILGTNPVPTFREMLRRMMRNKRGRALAGPSGRKRPLERPEEVDALVQAAAAEGAPELVLVLFGVGAGLRYGEMLGVRCWPHLLGQSLPPPRRDEQPAPRLEPHGAQERARAGCCPLEAAPRCAL